MAGAVEFKMDYKGIGQILKGWDSESDIVSVVKEATEKIASNTRGRSHGAPVVTQYYRTDRYAGSVAIASRFGLTYQAKNGALTKSASALGAGVDVTEEEYDHSEVVAR